MKLHEIAATNTSPELIVLVGLPGVGKDYWLKNFLKTSNKDYYVASTDDIIEAIAAEQGKTYSDIFQDSFKEANKKMNSDITNAIKERKDIIWNQTNLNPKKRASILSRFPHEYTKKAIIITAKEDVHNQRLEDRAESSGKNIPDNVMNSMRRSYVEPSTEEGFDDVQYVDNT